MILIFLTRGSIFFFTGEKTLPIGVAASKRKNSDGARGGELPVLGKAVVANNLKGAGCKVHPKMQRQKESIY